MQVAHKYSYKTTDPTTRRCIKCGTERPTSAFLAPMSAAHASMWGYGVTNVEGFTDIYGRFTRGYRRTPKKQKDGRRIMLALKCPDCRKPPHKPKHPAEKGTFKLVMSQIRMQRIRLNSMLKGVAHIKHPDFDNTARMYYFNVKRGMLDQAASQAREYRRRGIAMPFKRSKSTTPHTTHTYHYKWENLLSEHQRTQLVHAHAQVAWGRKGPEVF